MEFSDGLAELGELLFEPGPAEAGQRTQLHVEDVLGLRLTELERRGLERLARRGLVGRGPDGGDDLVDQVEAGLARRVVEFVSLARKAGYAVAGFEKVKDWLSEGRAKVLLQASDGSDRGKGKLWTPPGGRWFGCLTSSELGLAFGRDYVIHAALAAGGLAARVVEEAAKLNGLRKVDGGASAGKETKSA